jgi:hypothetical protein
MKSAACAATLLYLGASSLPRGVAALKPAYQEIYQTTTVATTNGNDAIGVTDGATSYLCRTDWVLYGTKCYYVTPGDMDFDASVEMCHTTLSAEVAIAESAAERDFLFSLIGDSLFWVGLYYNADAGKWLTAVYNADPVYTFWSGGEPNIPDYCAYDTVYTWLATPCTFSDPLLKIICRQAATTGGDSGGSVGVSQPPASVSGGAGGLLTVPANGELILFNQFINPSSGAESAYQFPELKFVEADEAIYRAGLVSVPCNHPLPFFLSLSDLDLILLSFLAGSRQRELSLQSLCLDLLLLFPRQSLLLHWRVQRLVCSTSADPCRCCGLSQKPLRLCSGLE